VLERHCRNARIVVAIAHQPDEARQCADRRVAVRERLRFRAGVECLAPDRDLQLSLR